MSASSHSKAKSRVAFVLAGLFFAAAIAIVVLFVMSNDKAANVSPAPNMDVSDVSISEVADTDGFPVVDWDYWLSVNPDIVGWVTIPGTEVDQPIVQAPASDPTYYLTHDVFGDYNINGCPYLDASCADEGLDSQNAVIFGHNMGWNQTMFGDLEYYTDLAFAQEHSRVLLQTPDKKMTLNVQGAAIISGWDQTCRTSFESVQDFDIWYGERFIECTVQLQEPNEELAEQGIITLVTCSYNYWSNERTVVYTAR